MFRISGKTGMIFFRLLSPAPYAKAIADLLHLIARHRYLLWDMASRDIREQYLGRSLGPVWAVIQPLFMVLVYLFVFIYVFKIRFGDAALAATPGGDFTLYILGGIIPFMACAASLNRSTGILSAHANLVKQVIFPIEVLPIKIHASILLSQVICTVPILVYMLYRYQALPLAIVLLPLVMGMQFAFLLGCAFILSVLTPFFRDMSELVSMLCTVLLYASPVFYRADMLPEALRPVLAFNPLTHFLTCYRDILQAGTLAHPWSWGISLALAVCAPALGSRLFGKLKPLLGNVL